MPAAQYPASAAASPRMAAPMVEAAAPAGVAAEEEEEEGLAVEVAPAEGAGAVPRVALALPVGVATRRTAVAAPWGIPAEDFLQVDWVVLWP